ncbi:MAG: rod shape-determining protein RodA [bacterium]
MINVRWDRILITISILLGLCGVGLVALASADQPWTFSALAQRQFIFLLIGIAVMLILSRLDYRLVCKYSLRIYAVGILLLVAVLVLGRVIGGSQRWIEFGSARIQPSEFAKLAVVFALSYSVMRLRHQIGWFWTSIACFIFILPALGLIILQPDLGTSIVFIAIWLGILFLGGMDWKIIFGYISVAILAVPIMLPFLMPYQRARLTGFLNPESDPLRTGYQVIQSKIAIGHGGWFGQGLFQGSQNNLGFIPGEHTDFIFAIASEELGIVGAGIILIVLFSLLLAGLAVSELTDDFLGKLVAGGLISMITFQVVVNVGVTMGLLPVTGIPLPFLSYGGSALLTNFAAVGMLVSIYRHAAIKGRMILIRGI